MRGVRERNKPPIPRAHTLGLANASAIDAWLLARPETVRAASVSGLASGLPVRKWEGWHVAGMQAVAVGIACADLAPGIDPLYNC